MKKIWKGVLSILCVATVSVSLGACTQVISAYDIAVKNGFVGTEEEWLLSLKGANGKDAESLDFDDLYEAAVAEGFTGSKLEFYQSLNIDIKEDNDTAQIARNITSVVSIVCAFYKNEKAGWGQTAITSKYYGASAGSGVIIDLNKEAGTAYVVTNYHVVYDNDCNTDNHISNDIYLYTYGSINGFSSKTGKDERGDYMKATYVGGAMDYDIAILKIEGSEVLKNKLVSEAKIGDSDKVVVGEKAYVVGNPEGAGIAVTSGAISVESEYITMTSTDGKRSVDYRVIRTDAAINGGNSGGALYNAKGELIGIVNAKSVGEDMDNMGYALPISSVKHVCQNIFDNGGLVKRAMLGVMVSMESCKVEFDENGHLRKTETFVVAEEATAATAAAYGRLKTGDVFRYIIINGGEKFYFTRQYQLNDVLMQVRKGDVVTLGIEREMVGETEVEITYDKETYFVAYA